MLNPEYWELPARSEAGTWFPVDVLPPPTQAPWTATTTGFGHYDKNTMFSRETLLLRFTNCCTRTTNSSDLLDDGERLLVLGDDPSDVPGDPGRVVTLRLQHITRHVHQVNAWTETRQRGWITAPLKEADVKMFLRPPAVKIFPAPETTTALQSGSSAISLKHSTISLGG